MRVQEKKKRRVGVFAQSAAALITVLILFEVALRMFPYARLEVTPQHFYEKDEFLGWKLRANQETLFRSFEYQHWVETNSSGYRDREHVLEKSSNQYRVVGLGGSFTFGFGVDYSATYLFQLEKLLQKEFADRDVEVMKMGVPGYSFKQNRKLIDDEVLKYNPDMIVLDFSVNTLMDSIRPVHEVYEGFLVKNRDQDDIFFKQKLMIARHSRLFQYGMKVYGLIDASLKRFYGSKQADSFQVKYRNKEKALSFIREGLSELSEITQKRGISLVVLYIPTRDQVYSLNPSRQGERYYYHDFGVQLERIANELGLSYVNLLSAMKADATEHRPFYFAIDGHWSPEGHRYAAQRLAENFSGVALPESKELAVTLGEGVQ